MPKNRIKTQVTSNIISSINLIKEHKLLSLSSVLVDMLFLFVYGFVFSLVFGKIGNYLYELYNLIIKSPDEIKTALLDSGLIAALRSTPELENVFNGLVIWFFVLSIAIYITYALFQGLSWKISYEIVGRKISYLSFLTKFSLISLFWFIFYIIYQILAYLSSLSNTISKNITQAPSVTPLGGTDIILWLFLITLTYFVLISYSLIGKYNRLGIIKNSFIFGFKMAKILLPSFLIILSIFLAINSILGLSFRISPKLMLVVGILTVLPAYTWARVFFSLTIDRIKQ